MSLILLGILNSQVSGAAAGAYDLLETQVLSSSASSVTFTGLGSCSDYKHLQIRAVSRDDRSADVTGTFLRFNGVSTASYAEHKLQGYGSGVSSNAGTNQTEIDTVSEPAANQAANIFGTRIIDILDFSSTNKNTTVRVLSGMVGASPYNYITLSSGVYLSTDAITSILLSPFASANFIAGSRFSLYGIKGA